MTVHNLAALADEQLTTAKSAASERSATTVTFSGQLRQTLIALVDGAELREHEAPPAATLQVLRGRVQLRWGDEHQELRSNDLTNIPGQRHSLLALEDSVVLLTVLAD